MGLAQDALAEASGLSHRYVRSIELAENSPSLSAIFQLCEALGVTPSELLDEVWAQR
jgi:transcriptional regulator with XRE-family HTH domain